MSSIIDSAEYFKSNFKKSTHYHELNQMIYIAKGNVSFNTSEGILNASEGNLIFLNHLAEHSINETSDDYERYVLAINPPQHFLSDKLIKIYIHLFGIALTSVHKISVNDNKKEFEEVIIKLWSETNSTDKMKDEMNNHLFSELLIMIYRLFPDKFKVLKEKNFDIIEKIRLRLEKNPENNYSLNNLATEFNISSSTLSHSFKKIVGTSVINYLNICRIDKAKVYLSETDIMISEIIDLCGFSDFSNFSRAFKCIVGFTPTQYRKNSQMLNT